MSGKRNTLGWGYVHQRALCLLAPAVAALLVAGGCASSQKKEEPKGEIIPAVQAEGTLNPPSVISGKPARDTRAIMQADETLSEADWKVLEKLGPRPIWQQIDKKKSRSKEKGSLDKPEPGSAV